jgi:hypothetical protein
MTMNVKMPKGFYTSSLHEESQDDAYPRDCCCWLLFLFYFFFLLFLLKLLKIIKHEFGRWAVVAPSSLLIFHFYATDV